MRYSGLEAGESRPLLLRHGIVDVTCWGQGPPLVMVPGLAGGWRLLAPLARKLAARNSVYLYDPRGDRGSASSRGHLLGDYARELSEVIENLGLERPMVFGVSFGGAVALEMATESPHHLGALTVMGAEARLRPNLGFTIARRVLERFPLPNDNRFLNQFFNLLHGGKPEPGPLPDFVVERCWETDQGVMAARLAALESFDVTDRLWRIDVPTLVLAGARDVIVPSPRQRALAQAIPGALFEEIPGAGHIGFLTHGDDVARHVRRLSRGARQPQF
jgi:pimeloyl-ACP methyl ester carboxylesterase